MRRLREPTRKARADTTEWLQLLRDSDYGRMNKVLNALQSMQADDIKLVSGHVLVRSIERLGGTVEMSNKVKSVRREGGMWRVSRAPVRLGQTNERMRS